MEKDKGPCKGCPGKAMETKTKLQQLQAVELDIFKEVVRICEKYGLTYYMSAGTFLGAVRHKGFIPWDDDMDMRMPRPDYEKLLSVLPDELREPFAARHFYHDRNVHRYFCRVENTKVRLHRNHTVHGQDSNAWIDIFPLDGMPENTLLAGCRKIHLLYRKMWMQLSVFDEIVDVKKKRALPERIIVFLALHTPIQKCLSWEKTWKKLDKALKSYDVGKSKYYMNFMSAYKFRDIIPKAIYGKGAKYPFEDQSFNGPEDYDAFLKILYGDYMKLPPEEKRKKHGLDDESIVIETDA